MFETGLPARKIGLVFPDVTVKERIVNKTHTDTPRSETRTETTKKISAQRVFHSLECRYLSQEARSMASCLMDSQSVPPEVTEQAIQQALVLGVISGSTIDASTFESLFKTVALDPAFKIPFSALLSLPPSGKWVC